MSDVVPSIQIYSYEPLPQELRGWEFQADAYKLLNPEAKPHVTAPILRRFMDLKVALFRASWESSCGVFLCDEGVMPRATRNAISAESSVKNFTGKLTFASESAPTFYKSQALVDRHPATGGWRIARRRAANAGEQLAIAKVVEDRGDDYHWLLFNSEVRVVYIDATAVTRT